jgi:hypothetical protein
MENGMNRRVFEKYGNQTEGQFTAFTVIKAEL